MEEERWRATALQMKKRQPRLPFSAAGQNLTCQQHTKEVGAVRGKIARLGKFPITASIRILRRAFAAVCDGSSGPTAHPETSGFLTWHTVTLYLYTDTVKRHVL
jgi:hypothetical protein